jgi:hypothetical protein
MKKIDPDLLLCLAVIAMLAICFFVGASGHTFRPH